MPLYSVAFVIFLGIVFALHWGPCRRTATAQNSLLLVAGTIFCCWEDWRFGVILLTSTVFNFLIGRQIPKQRNLFYLGLAGNLANLAYYKYLPHNASFILPLGISFYTFQAIGYLIDIYNDDAQPSGQLLPFATYMTWFPKLIAGPIQPPEPFIGQIQAKRTFDRLTAVDGLRQMLWGAFAKLVIANNCATFTGPIFEHYDRYPASTLLLGSFLYTCQVYCDFSGYSNAAIGISKLFGVPLVRNFNAPFFATNMADFWRRWHMSLSAWMMRYVFTPLSFTLRRWGKGGIITSILATFLVIGCWHGPNWTYIVFGGLHGLYFIPLILTGRMNRAVTKWNIPASIGVFLLVMLTMIFFGSDTVASGAKFLRALLSPSILVTPTLPESTGWAKVIATIFFFLVLLLVEFRQRHRQHEMQLDHIRQPAVRVAIYYGIVICILLFGSVVHLHFLYAQF